MQQIPQYQSKADLGEFDGLNKSCENKQSKKYIMTNMQEKQKQLQKYDAINKGNESHGKY